MEILIKAAQLLLSLSFLIILHELGHFIPARWFKVRVEKFYLFFDAGFSLFKFKKGDTEYGIGWLPLGGYVKIAGMIDESMDSDQIAEAPKEDEFRSKPAWQRLVIMIGGVVVNLLLGIFIYMMILFAWGRDYVAPGNVLHGFAVSPTMEALGFQDGDQILKIDNETPFDVLSATADIMLHGTSSIEVQHPDGQIETLDIPEGIDMELFASDERAFEPRRKNTVLDSVILDLAAYKAGFKNGDKVISVNGTPIEYWDEFVGFVDSNSDSSLKIGINRSGEMLTINVTPQNGKIGVMSSPEIDEILISEHKDYSFGESISHGLSHGIGTLNDYVTQFKFVFTKKGSTGIGGFGAIGNLFPSVWDWQAFWEKTAFISIMLAFMNLLPIPALDGGHVMFLIYEMISGKAPSDKFLMRAQIVGMVLLLSLMLYANGLDIYKAIFG